MNTLSRLDRYLPVTARIHTSGQPTDAHIGRIWVPDTTWQLFIGNR
jgi:hypothetical protein